MFGEILHAHRPEAEYASFGPVDRFSETGRRRHPRREDDMIHDRLFHWTDRSDALTNTEKTTAPETDTAETTVFGDRSRFSRDGSRSGSTDDEDTSTDSTDGAVTHGERRRTVLPPAVYREGQTVTASGPTDDAVDGFLREVYRTTPAVDGVIVLTTERSATEVLRAYTEPSDENRAGIGIIDTRSAGQYIEDVYRESPIHYTAADSDIERTAMSFTELVEALSTTPAQRLHLLVDSYTALCESLSPRDRARLLNTFHSQIDGYRVYVTSTGDADEVLRRWLKGAIWIEESEEGIETRYRRI